MIEYGVGEAAGKYRRWSGDEEQGEEKGRERGGRGKRGRERGVREAEKRKGGGTSVEGETGWAREGGRRTKVETEDKQERRIRGEGA